MSMFLKCKVMLATLHLKHCLTFWLRAFLGGARWHAGVFDKLVVVPVTAVVVSDLFDKPNAGSAFEELQRSNLCPRASLMRVQMTTSSTGLSATTTGLTEKRSVRQIREQIHSDGHVSSCIKLFVLAPMRLAALGFYMHLLV